MKKIYIAILVVAVMLLAQTGVFAAPDSLPVDTTGNTAGLVVVTKPKNPQDSTFNESYIISGCGKEGTTVSLYSFSPETGMYEKFYTEMQYIDESGVSQVLRTPSESTIGTSGLFMNTITLARGENTILVHAENGDSVQVMKLLITKYNYNIIDLIKSLTD